jgi:hypothetical protein
MLAARRAVRADLPVYTVLVALYREASIVPQLLVGAVPASLAAQQAGDQAGLRGR